MSKFPTRAFERVEKMLVRAERQLERVIYTDPKSGKALRPFHSSEGLSRPEAKALRTLLDRLRATEGTP